MSETEKTRSTAVTVAAIAGITIMQTAALIAGLNGALALTAVAAVAGLGGWAVHNLFPGRRQKPEITDPDRQGEKTTL